MKKLKKEISKKINILQRSLKEKNKSVLIIIEGYESSGKGYFINQIIKELDPRAYKVNVFEKPTKEELRRPFMWCFFINTPKMGEIRIHDRSYYMNILDSLDNIDHNHLTAIKNTEKTLVDNNTIIIKFFIDISKEKQLENIKKLQSNKNTKFRINKFDIKQNDNFEKYKKHIEEVIKKTNFNFCNWNILDGNNKKESSIKMLEIIEKEISRNINTETNKDIKLTKIEKNILKDIDLNKNISKNEYKEELKALQKKVKKLSYKLYTKKISTIVVFEGWDAAGKGGAIKRLIKNIDPRGYNVIPIGAPSKNELKHHYLWRFYNQLPKSGHITIFDRSWYGRVLVEKIEKFSNINAINRSYNEINDFEKILSSKNTILIKFFIHIDKDTQLKRFNQRQDNPSKNYKITDEDWRNREKWDKYETAINEMIARTSKNSKWNIIEGNQKEYARIKVLKTFINEVEEHLKK